MNEPIFKTIAQSRYYEIVFIIITVIAIALFIIFIANTSMGGLGGFDIFVLILQVLVEAALIAVFVAYWVLRKKYVS